MIFNWFFMMPYDLCKRSFGFKGFTNQFITKLFSKIQALSLSQNPQLRLHFVSLGFLLHSLSDYLTSSVNT